MSGECACLLLPDSFIFGMSESQLPGYFLAHEGHGEAWTLELEGNLHILSLSCRTISSNIFYNISAVSDCMSSLYTLSLVALKYTIIKNITIATF